MARVRKGRTLHVGELTLLRLWFDLWARQTINVRQLLERAKKLILIARTLPQNCLIGGRFGLRQTRSLSSRHAFTPIEQNISSAILRKMPSSFSMSCWCCRLLAGEPCRLFGLRCLLCTAYGLKGLSVSCQSEPVPACCCFYPHLMHKTKPTTNSTHWSDNTSRKTPGLKSHK